MATLTHTTLGQLKIAELTLDTPLTSDGADRRTIEIFARIATKPGGEHLPYLLFLQGGPGNEAPYPSLNPLNPSWLAVALEQYQVVFLDQRGTGKSTPVTDALVDEYSTAEVIEYLTHLRADGIVRDCEAIRHYLNVDTWSVLGQSFGGFTALHYLSTHAESVAEVYFTGGLSAIDCSTEDIYLDAYRRMRLSSEKFYRRFPTHRDTVAGLLDLCAQGDLILPTGEVVSQSRLRSLGHLLGSNDGWFRLHQLLELDPRSLAFRYDLAELLPFGGRNPIYFVLHESSYADGVVTNWSAEGVFPEEFAADPTLLTGEHVFSEWLDTVPAFKPWKDVAEGLAVYPWPKLYSTAALEKSQITGAAAVYVNDVFVPVDFSLDTANHLLGVALYVTSEHEHNGLRASNGDVLRHLFDLTHGVRVR